jgi:hypothetical protein
MASERSGGAAIARENLIDGDQIPRADLGHELAQGSGQIDCGLHCAASALLPAGTISTAHP